MGASSVTGVGQGSADKAGQKGSEHLFVGVEKLIGPRIVFAGSATFSASTTKAVTLPSTLPGVAADYIVIVTGQTTAANVYKVSSITTSGFTITSNNSNSDVVGYIVVRVTNATVTSFPTHN